MSDWVRACNKFACVEVSCDSDAGLVYVRDSKDPGWHLVFTAEEFAEFLDGAKRGVFDGLVCAPPS